MVMDGSGYTLSFARSVDEALSVAKRDGRPDLVLSDAALGTGSGYDLCAQIRADAALRDVPVYILASAQTPYDEARGRKVGADGHLAKPFESQALLDAVASALATPVARPAAAAPSRGADVGASASRFDEDVIAEDEDSYGEITIERGSAPAPSAGSWAARPPSRPSSVRPLSIPAPTPSAAAAARAPMIGTPRPASGMPAVPVSPGVPALPSPGQPRHTVMGFPSVRPSVVGKPAAPLPPPVAAPSAPAPSRPATIPPATSVPMRPPVLAPAPPVPSRPTLPAPPSPGSLPGAPARPVPPPRPAPPALPVPEAAPPPQAPTLIRRVVTPPAPAAPVAPPVAAAVAAAADKIDQTMAALAARGPEFQAIAKLSREIIEQVVWEVVPELAEVIIRREVDRLASAKK